MMLNLSVNFMGFYVLCNIHWVRIDMNQVSPHSFMMLPLPRFIHAFRKKKGGHESLQIIHQDNSNHFTSTFRDDYSEYEDRMDISKLVLEDPLEKQVTPASSSFSPEGIVE